MLIFSVKWVKKVFIFHLLLGKFSHLHSLLQDILLRQTLLFCLEVQRFNSSTTFIARPLQIIIILFAPHLYVCFQSIELLFQDKGSPSLHHRTSRIATRRILSLSVTALNNAYV
ncbi:hypothetical protein AAZV13_14G006500 [Glycine max]